MILLIYLWFLCFVLFNNLVSAFQSPTMFLLAGATNINRLQNIIASKAAVSTIFNAINEEVFTNNYIINDITSTHIHLQNDLSSLIIFGGLLYYRYNTIIPKIDKKLGDIEYFYKVRQKLNLVVIFVLFLLFKNVGCAF